MIRKVSLPRIQPSSFHIPDRHLESEFVCYWGIREKMMTSNCEGVILILCDWYGSMKHVDVIATYILPRIDAAIEMEGKDKTHGRISNARCSSFFCT